MANNADSLMKLLHVILKSTWPFKSTLAQLTHVFYVVMDFSDVSLQISIPRVNVTTVISKLFGTSIFMESFALE